MNTYIVLYKSGWCDHIQALNLDQAFEYAKDLAEREGEELERVSEAFPRYS